MFNLGSFQMESERRSTLNLILVSVIIYLIQSTSFVESIRWLAITTTISPSSPSSQSYLDPPPSCDHLSNQLIKGQLKFCKNHPEFIGSIRSGAEKALNECQFQFRSRRWNCSLPTVKVFKGKRSSNETGLNLPLKRRFRSVKKFPIVPEGTREAAFLHAISAAGVAHSVTKQCSAGNSPNCGCDRSMSDRSNEVDYYGLSSNFKWAGCSDNIDYGVSLSRSFVDAKDHRLSRKKGNKTAKALMNLHNNEAGRKIIMKHMKVDCKCHGVSGSCEIKTCWRVMPTFREIGEVLRDKFERASQVVEKRIGSRKTLMGRDGQPHSDTDLVYVKSSPDFCEEDLKRGSLGTKGRRCNKNPNSHEACQNLCCNRGFSTQRIVRTERCKCKFQWCCSVSCSECRKEVEISTCN